MHTGDSLSVTTAGPLLVGTSLVMGGILQATARWSVGLVKGGAHAVILRKDIGYAHAHTLLALA